MVFWLNQAFYDRKRGSKFFYCYSIINEDMLNFQYFFRRLPYSPYTQSANFLNGFLKNVICKLFLLGNYIILRQMDPTRLSSCPLLYHPFLWTAGLQKHSMYSTTRGLCPLNLKKNRWRQFSRLSASFLQIFLCRYLMLTLKRYCDEKINGQKYSQLMDHKFLVGPGLIFDLFYHCCQA